MAQPRNVSGWVPYTDIVTRSDTGVMFAECAEIMSEHLCNLDDATRYTTAF